MDPAWILIIGWFVIGALIGLLVFAVGWAKHPPRKGQWVRPATGGAPFWMPPVSAGPIIARAMLATMLGLCFVPILLLIGLGGAAKTTNPQRAARSW